PLEAEAVSRRAGPSAKDAAGSVVDIPAVEAENAELDIVADAGKALAVLNQVPDGAVLTVGKACRRRAVAPLNGAVLGRRLVTGQPRAVEVDNADVWKIGHMGDLMPEAVLDGSAHAAVAADRVLHAT